MRKIEDKNYDSQNRHKFLILQENITNNKKLIIENLNLSIEELNIYLGELKIFLDKLMYISEEGGKLVLDKLKNETLELSDTAGELKTRASKVNNINLENSVTREEGEVLYLENTINLFIDMKRECFSKIIEICSFISNCELPNKELNKVDEEKMVECIELLFNNFVKYIEKIDSSSKELINIEREVIESILLKEIKASFLEFDSDFLQADKLEEFKEKNLDLESKKSDLIKEIHQKVQEEVLRNCFKESIIIQFNLLATLLSVFIPKLLPKFKEIDTEEEEVRKSLFALERSFAIIEEMESLQKNFYTNDEVVNSDHIRLQNCIEDIKKTLQNIKEILQNLLGIEPLSTNSSVVSEMSDSIYVNSSTIENDAAIGAIQVEEKIACDAVEVVCDKKEELKKSSTRSIIQDSKSDDNYLFQDKIGGLNVDLIINFFIIAIILFATLTFVATSYDSRNLIYSALAIIPLLVVALSVISLKTESPKATLDVTQPILGVFDVCNSETIIKD